ncbi:AAA family ATPase [Wenzhouxiangella sp. XN79A]|uniref:AAA family ATPase n=1 Tax=Wenzhouxiangella sp. XN79A TaxID=2724193 RepID=UPI00144A8982|nr:ATP-binding protein [Wenzhouxiangella sp. XN79A]NKI35135.1 AAA family ATPase [Wenzhouxiangella sp. XN79A]
MNETTFERERNEGTRKKETTCIHPAIDGFIGRIRQWMLRMLVDQGALFDDRIGLPEAGAEIDALFPLDDDSKVRADVIVQMHRSMPAESASVTGGLADNIERLCRHLGLSAVEADVLVFLIVYRASNLFERVADLAFRKIDLPGFAWRLSVVTGHSPDDIEAALQPDAALVASGLVRHCSPFGLGRVPSVDALVEINHRGMKLLTSTEFEMVDLLESAVRPATRSDLKLRDFEFMAEQRDLAIDYLRALRNEGLARSILFDGPPGVGKTELARLLASELDFDGYEIKEVDHDGDAAAAGERLQYHALAQNLIALGSRNGLIVFDEADAVLATDMPAPMQRYRTTKAALIRRLDTLRVPTIWITNHADEMDPALRRRFDLVLRFRTPPAHARLRMLDAQLPSALQRDPKVRALCAEKATTPARIEQAGRVARLIAGQDIDRQGRVFCRVLEENLGLELSLDARRASDNGLPYRPEIINASEDLEALTSALTARPQARIGLYGPPGTGKTRFAQHLADRCGLQLVEYRASDLLDRYLGESEKNIRSMFDECRGGRTLLLLDEADSLLRSRQHARQNFEVNQVNELLKGLENFDGLFVAGTNLMDAVDPAVLRRLDLKIRFDWLRPEQRWRLFLDLAQETDLTPRGLVARRLRRRMDTIDHLTPGDFAVVARRLRLREGPRHAGELVDLLLQEVDLKPEAKSACSGIGFTAPVGSRP